MEKRILLVNDSKFESLALRDMLNKLNYEVEIADEFDALYVVEQFEPSVVIVNYFMQKSRGDKLINLIKKGQPGTKCLLSSNDTINKSGIIFKNIDGIIYTPVSIFQLKDTLKKIGVNVKDKEKRYFNRFKHCNSCLKNLTNIKDDIFYCPYCGELLTNNMRGTLIAGGRI